MLLGIILCGIIQSIYLMICIFVWTRTPMPESAYAFVFGVLFFVFLLSFASILMNAAFLKKAIIRSNRNYVGLWFSIVTNALCILLVVFLWFIRQTWIDFGYPFISPNHAYLIYFRSLI